jgi:hypothetical protein
MSAFYWFVLASLAVWRITHLLAAEDGPWDAFANLRALAGDRFFGKLLDCFYCLSLWIALPFAWLLAEGWKHRILFWLASSGAAILLERATGDLREPPIAPYFEEPKEKHDGMLRR